MPATAAPADDGTLLARYAQQRDEEAFALVVQRHLPLVLGVCRRLVGADAEDAVQATFLVLARRAGDLTARAEVASWLHRTATHLALRLRASLAARRRHEAAAAAQAVGETVMPPSSPSPEDLARLRSCLDTAIGRLPAQEREAVILRHLEGLPVQACAQRLGVTPEAFGMRLLRARQRLQRLLAPTLVGLVDFDAALALVIATDPSSSTLTAPLLARLAHPATASAPSPRAQALVQAHLARGHAPLLAAVTLVIALLLVAAIAHLRGAAGHPDATSALPPAPATHAAAAPRVAAALPTSAAADPPRTDPATTPPAEPTYLRLADASHAGEEQGRSSEWRLVQFADHGGHHLASWSEDPQMVLGTIMTCTCEHASIAALAAALGKQRDVPISPASTEVGAREVPHAAIEQQPLRQVLDTLCAAANCRWSIVHGTVVIDALPAKPQVIN